MKNNTKKESSVLLKDADPLRGMTKEDFLEKLRKQLQGRVEEAWIFGSFARDELHAGSDIDLALVAKTDKPFLERSEAFFDLLDIGPEIQVLVYTKEEWARLTKNPSPGFWVTLVEDKVRLL